MKNWYNILSKYYTKITDPSKIINTIISIMHKYNITWNSILDLWCWTGDFLIKSKESNPSGVFYWIDESNEMLKEGKWKSKWIKFLKKNIINYNINEKFELVTCLYDTINHIIKYSDWRNIFKNAKKSLKSDWYFIFDINTIHKLNNIAKEKPLLQLMDDINFVLKVQKNKQVVEWNFDVFEKMEWDKYNYKNIRIDETSFKVEKVLKDLKNIFSEVYYCDSKLNNLIDVNKANRVFFICKK